MCPRYFIINAKQLPWMFLQLYEFVWNVQTLHCHFHEILVMHVSFRVYYCSSKNTRKKKIKTMIMRWKCKAFWISRDSSLIFLPLTRGRHPGGVLLMQQPVPFFLSLVNFQLQIFLPSIPDIFSFVNSLRHLLLSWYLHIKKSRQAGKRWWRNIQEEVVQAVVSYKTHQERQKQGMKKTRKEYRHGPRVRVREMKETTFLPIKHVIENH